MTEIELYDRPGGFVDQYNAEVLSETFMKRFFPLSNKFTGHYPEHVKLQIETKEFKNSLKVEVVKAGEGFISSIYKVEGKFTVREYTHLWRLAGEQKVFYLRALSEVSP